MATSVATAELTPQKRSPALGIVAFAVAILAYLSMPVLIVAGASAGFVAPAAGGPASFAVPLLVFGLIAVVAILAAIMRRGRGWAIAALVIAVANTYSPIHAAIADLFRVIFG